MRVFLAGAIWAVMAAGSALAQEAAGLRAGDTPFAPAELTELLSGQAVTFFDGGTARFGAEGAYSYIYEGSDQVWAGTWAAGQDSAVCVAFENGTSRCDTYVDDGKRLVLITEAGDRFPAKSREPF
ncbi:hypothetical protein [Pseudoruegeria sp. SHC-113]|uniref:hypothetical protein n=1 Tax=Pseudoruegeria sp. SHC-113 TaxID=2855439 RepID=UPI0021BA8558|nr:hypothetical protein [Pseudoruegeria sp. SHC-113]MCT8159198.1 hypothetical protein [Pseudoruegeria sp. SHC-113]